MLRWQELLLERLRYELCQTLHIQKYQFLNAEANDGFILPSNTLAYLFLHVYAPPLFYGYTDGADEG